MIHLLFFCLKLERFGYKIKKRKCNDLQILFYLFSGVGGIRTLVQTSNT